MEQQARAANRPPKSRAANTEQKVQKSPRFTPRDDTVGFLIWDVRRAFSRDFAQRIAPHGVSLSTFWILRILWDEDSVTQAQLIQKGKMKGPTIVGIVAQLEREGFVTRTPDAKDSRKKLIKLTTKGHNLRKAILPITELVNKQALKGFSAEERSVLKDMLRRLRTNIGV